MQKTIIMTGMFIGSCLGGLIPLLWGDSMLSMSSIFFNGLGGFIGIYFAYKISQGL